MSPMRRSPTLAVTVIAITISACSQQVAQDDQSALGFHLGMDKHSAYEDICTGRASHYVKWVEFFSAGMPDRHDVRDHNYSGPGPACSPYSQFSKYVSWDVLTNDKYEPLPVRSSRYCALYRIELDFKGDELVGLTRSCAP